MGTRIKNHQVLKEILLPGFHPKLVALSIWCLVRWGDLWITSGYREGDSGVHGTLPCRALDVSSRPFIRPEAMALDANIHWTYDPERPKFTCVLYHKTPGGVWHFHLQVHPRTLYLGG